MDFRSAAKLLAVNLKTHFLPHAAAAILTALCTPLLFAISSLDERQAAQPIEMLLSITGIILLTPVFLPEQSAAVRDVIRSKKTDHTQVCLMRVLYSAAALAVLIGIFTAVMYEAGSCVTLRHAAGGFATALFLGSLGVLVAGVTGNTPAAYMVSLVYYMANVTMKQKLGNFYLFSMCAGSFREKYWLLGGAVALITVGIIGDRIRKM